MRREHGADRVSYSGGHVWCGEGWMEKWLSFHAAELGIFGVLRRRVDLSLGQALVNG